MCWIEIVEENQQKIFMGAYIIPNILRKINFWKINSIYNKISGISPKKNIDSKKSSKYV